MKRFLILPKILFSLFLLAGAFWSCGAAIWVLRWPLPLCALFGIILFFFWLFGTFRTAAWIPLLIAELSLYFCFLSLTPEKLFHDRPWRPECAKLPEITREKDNTVTIRNVRDFVYRSTTDFTPNYKTMHVDPAKLESLDLVVSHWGNLQPVAHTMLCFVFSDGQQIAVSLEPRVAVGEKGGDLFMGIYRRYAVFLVLATPEDLFGVRQFHRGESLYRYQIKASSQEIRRFWEQLIDAAESLQTTPRFYHTFRLNCVTPLKELLKVMSIDSSDPRLLFNGFSDHLLFEKDFLTHRDDESFDSLKSRSMLPGLSSGKKDTSAKEHLKVPEK